jgi:signal transduction histidine kinase
MDILEFNDGRVFERASVPQMLDDQPVGRVFSFRDVTEQHRLLEREQRAREEAQAAERRASFLAHAGNMLAESLDLASTLKKVAEVSLPAFADWCVVDLMDDDGTIRRVTVETNDPNRREIARQMQAAAPRPEDKFGVTTVLRSGKPLMASHIDPEAIEANVTDPPRLEVVRQIGIQAAMIVPMVVRGRSLGALTFIRTRTASYSPEDLRLAEELCFRVGAAVDNAILYRRACEAAEAREEFLSIASHELKTPITSLLLQLELLTKLVANRPSGEPAGLELARSVAEQGREQCLRLHALIDDLLDVTRVARRIELEREAVAMDELVRGVLARFRTQLAEAGCTLDTRLVPVQGEWDRSRLEQVVTNLLSNAVKYGRGTRIEVAVEDHGDAAAVSVRDHGIGIPKEMRERIFDRFTRAVKNREFKGLGLGLYIVKHIVDAHGGQIAVQSDPGQGSCFVVTLPKSPKTAVSAARNSATPAPQRVSA